MLKKVLLLGWLTFFSPQYSLSDGDVPKKNGQNTSELAIDKLKAEGDAARISTDYLKAWRYSVTDKNWFSASAKTISYLSPDSAEQLPQRLAVNYISADLSGIDILTLYDYTPFDGVADSAFIRNNCSVDRAKAYHQASDEGNLAPFQPLLIPTEEQKEMYKSSITEFIEE